MAMVVADTLEHAVHAASLFELEYEAAQAMLNARDVIARPAAPDEKDGQIRHGSIYPITSSSWRRRSSRTGAANRQASIRLRRASTRATPRQYMRITPSNCPRRSPAGTATS